jgi:hypothetical protein
LTFAAPASAAPAVRGVRQGDERAQVVQEYESGKAVPAQAVLASGNITQDWEPVALRTGAPVETVRKVAAGTNRKAPEALDRVDDKGKREVWFVFF